ncbi:MAG: hypothetical protein AB2417_18055 [Clostridiaceae bacterium]
MKRLYIVEKIMMALTLIFLALGLHLIIKSKPIGYLLTVIANIIIFIGKSDYFKKIEYKNVMVDSIFRIATIITCIYILIMSVNILFIK